MDIERRALYNSLRFNWLLDPSEAVEGWQVENYRELSTGTAFDRLAKLGVKLDKSEFISQADNYDTPEDFCDALSTSAKGNPIKIDQIYLLVFELWRRLMPEKPSLSIFCDELDYQIHLYDSGQLNNSEAVQDVLANLQVILEENADQGADPVEIFSWLSEGCANDVESFLYDFISEQIDNDNMTYASELLEGLSEYMEDVRWFDFLKARVLANDDPETAQRLMHQLAEEAGQEADIEFNMEMLTFLAREGDDQLFRGLLKKTIPLLKKEDDFQEILAICSDYFHFLDQDQKEQAIQDLYQKRSEKPLEASIDLKDPDLLSLQKILA